MLAIAIAAVSAQASNTIVFPPSTGPGRRKHVVLLAGDEEYRSEEMLPQLAKILSTRHGFKCTVVFSQNEHGELDPENQIRQPGLEALKSADVCVMMVRFRQWDEGMQHFANYYLSGKPIIAVRTSTHAFQYPNNSTSAFKHYSWNSKVWPGGFGKQVLGETWVSHWGNHGSQATRGIAVTKHPILNGVTDVFGTTDVYEAAPPPDAEVLMRGEVVAGMASADSVAVGQKKTATGTVQSLNDPMMPILWLRDRANEANKRNKIVTCTMGSATDFVNPGFRRLMVNSVFWTSRLNVPPDADVSFVGKYEPSNFGFGGYRRGVRPADMQSLK